MGGDPIKSKVENRISRIGNGNGQRRTGLRIENRELVEAVAEKLKARGETVAVAETNPRADHKSCRHMLFELKDHL